jgi:exodeoxyribonuclease VII large subunit
MGLHPNDGPVGRPRIRPMPPNASRKRPRPMPHTASRGKSDRNLEGNDPKSEKVRKKPERKVFTVTEATLKVKKVVEEAFPPVWILGEVSSCRQPQSGHLYFNLKDGRSILHAVMFRGAFETGLAVSLKDGMEVLVLGRLSIYERGSEVQVIATRIEAHGEGALELQREALERKFAKAGLFSRSRKQLLPKYPRRIGIVTSPTGAAIRDILTTLDRQWPRLHVVIAPARVQGEGAAEQIGQAIDDLNQIKPALDLLIVSRGGGSVEHLWAFNLEPVVLAIARSHVPVISGVGHETDETLADLVADLRCATPTAAAKAAVPELAELLDHLADSQRRLKQALCRQVTQARKRLDTIKERYGFRAIRDHLNQQVRDLDSISERLDRALKHKVSQQRELLAALSQRHALGAPKNRLEEQKRRLDNVAERFDRAASSQLQKSRAELEALSPERFHRAIERQLQSHQQGLAQKAAQLEALSPLKVLARGYGLALSEGRVLKDSHQVKTGDLVEIHLAQGQFQAKVTTVKHKDAKKRSQSHD